MSVDTADTSVRATYVAFFFGISIFETLILSPHMLSLFFPVHV